MTSQSPRSPNWDCFGTPPWEYRDKKPFGCGCREEAQGEPLAGREATAPSIIREIEKVQGGEQAPRNGGLALPKDVAVKPFSPKGLFNANLMLLLPILTRGSNGPPGGHADLGRGFPRLKKNSLEGVSVVEVLAASLGPKIIEQEALKDVEGLTAVSESARVIAVKIRGVVIFFENGFPEEDEGPGDVEAVGRLPFVPNTVEGLPSLPSRGAIHEAVLGRFRESLVTALASGRDSHDLEPSTDRQPIVEDQPGECPHLAWTGVVPHPSNDLGDRRVSEVKKLNEGNDAGGVLLPPCISVSPLGRITKERGIANVARLLPVPVSGVPLELGDEAGLENPVDWGFFSWGGKVLGQFERCPMALLRKHSDQLVPFKRDDDVKRVGCLDSASA